MTVPETLYGATLILSITEDHWDMAVICFEMHCFPPREVAVVWKTWIRMCSARVSTSIDYMKMKYNQRSGRGQWLNILSLRTAQGQDQSQGQQRRKQIRIVR